MTPEQFVYWLQGFVEISGQKELDETQLKIVQDHLDLVLIKVTPERRPIEQKKCDKTLPPELEQLIKEATDELHKPRYKRRDVFKKFRKEREEPIRELRCGPIHMVDPWNRTYC